MATRVYAATSDVVVRRAATARILDPSAGGGLTALRIADGSIAWHAAPPPCASRANCSPAQSGGGHGDSRRRLLRIVRRASAGVLDLDGK